LTNKHSGIIIPDKGAIMNSILNLSEATLLALHSMAIIAKEGEKLVNTKHIAQLINASGNHLAKILQRLNRAGLIKSIRGPRGGFMLSKDSGKISLLEIFESIEGKFKPKKCLMNCDKCPFKNCILGTFHTDVNKRFVDYFGTTYLSDFEA